MLSLSLRSYSLSVGFRFSMHEDFEQRENLKPSEHIISVGYIEYDFSDSFDSPIPCHLTETFALKEKYLWMFVPFVNTHGTSSRLFSYACFTDSDKQVWMPFVGNNVYRVESMEMNERVLTLRNGSDEMVIRVTFDPDCNQALDTTNEMWHRIRESPVFSLSGPFDWRICDTLGLSVDLCETAKENSCAISRAKQNYCIRLDNVGPSKRCDATMEIIKLTGMFREKSLLVSETPMKAMGSEWIRGNRSLAMITPCFK